MAWPLSPEEQALMQRFKEESEEGMTLVSTSYATGMDTDAEPKLRHLVQLQRRALGPEHPETMRSMHFHAASLMAERRFADAEVVLRDVVQLRQRVLGIEDTKTLISVRDLGNCMVQQGRDAEAEPILRSVYKINTRVLGPGQWGTLGCQVILARCLMRVRKRSEAEGLLRDALVALEGERAEPDHDWDSLHAETMISLGHCLRQMRRHADAEPLYRNAVSLCRRKLDEQHKMTGIAMSTYAQCLSEMGQHRQAVIMFRITLQHHTRLYGENDERTRGITARLAAAAAAVLAEGR